MKKYQYTIGEKIVPCYQVAVKVTLSRHSLETHLTDYYILNECEFLRESKYIALDKLTKKQALDIFRTQVRLNGILGKEEFRGEEEQEYEDIILPKIRKFVEEKFPYLVE